MKRVLKFFLITILLILMVTACSSTVSKPSSIAGSPNAQATVKSSSTANNSSTTANTNLKVGDYVQMGSYYDEPILWRCADIDENGSLMFSDKILAIKPIDAAGNHTYVDGTPQADTDGWRTNNGSNLWETSDIRSWLNSTATAGNVNWLDCCPPTSDKIYNGYNAYATEKGFIADGNFTFRERNAIKTVTQKSLLNYKDKGMATNGTTEYILGDNISSVQNYDTAYAHNVTDKIFLLDVKQVNKVYENLGASYYIGKPTQKAVDNSGYKNYTLAADMHWHYALRSPCAKATYSDLVSYVNASGYFGYLSVNVYDFGIRPAFYINLSSVNYKSGNGSAGAPYLLGN